MTGTDFCPTHGSTCSHSCINVMTMALWSQTTDEKAFFFTQVFIFMITFIMHGYSWQSLNLQNMAPYLTPYRELWVMRSMACNFRLLKIQFKLKFQTSCTSPSAIFHSLYHQNKICYLVIGNKEISAMFFPRQSETALVWYGFSLSYIKGLSSAGMAGSIHWTKGSSHCKCAPHINPFS